MRPFFILSIYSNHSPGIGDDMWPKNAIASPSCALLSLTVCRFTCEEASSIKREPTAIIAPRARVNCNLFIVWGIGD